jgi:hypothetical protein
MPGFIPLGAPPPEDGAAFAAGFASAGFDSAGFASAAGAGVDEALPADAALATAAEESPPLQPTHDVIARSEKTMATW